MAENPLAIRVNENIKTLFNELASQSEFENKGEFLSRLLALYQSESSKQNVSVMKTAIETVELLTTRLLETLNGTAAAIVTKEERQKQELEEQKKSFDETRELLQKRIKSLEDECLLNEDRLQAFIQEKEESELKITESQNRIKELNETINDKTTLVEEYKQKSINLQNIISKNESYDKKLKEMEKANAELEWEIKESKAQIEFLNKKLEEQTIQQNEKLNQMKKELNIEHERNLLEIKIEHQKELQIQQKSYSDKVESLLEKLEANKKTTLATTIESADTLSSNKRAATRKTTNNKKTNLNNETNKTTPNE